MKLAVGMSAEVTRTFSSEDLAQFARLAGQPAPDCEVPAPLIGAMFSYLLGVKLPGPGTNYLKQSTEFAGTAAVTEALTAKVEITRLRPEKNLVDLHTRCVDSTGRTIASGRALVYFENPNS